MAVQINYLSSDNKIYMKEEDYNKLNKYKKRLNSVIFRKMFPNGCSDPESELKRINIISFMLAFHGIPRAVAGHSFATYYKKECNSSDIQCQPNKNRSAVDMFITIRTMERPDLSWSEFRDALISAHNYIRYYPKRIRYGVGWLVCPQIKMLVFSYKRNGENISDKVGFKFTRWTAPSSSFGIDGYTLKDIFVLDSGRDKFEEACNHRKESSEVVSI